MHKAATLHESFEDARSYGWKVQGIKHSWESMVCAAAFRVFDFNLGILDLVLKEGFYLVSMERAANFLVLVAHALFAFVPARPVRRCINIYQWMVSCRAEHHALIQGRSTG